MASVQPLPPHRLRALYDLLIHHQLYYGEVIKFNEPDGIDGYGPPFDPTDSNEPSSSPILQTLLQRFILSLPSMTKLSDTFWVNVRELMKRFAAANMSDSYDHTGLGLRRTLATGCSAMLEYPARGSFAKSKLKDLIDKDYDDYDPSDADDVKEAWEHFLHDLVHGDLIDEMFEKIAETDDLSLHPPLVQAAHEYILVKYVALDKVPANFTVLLQCFIKYSSKVQTERTYKSW
jgi:PX-associated